ncbi:putative methyltransferase [Sulfolobus polyhedral virus 2]|uniref:Putative methyltransferase n=1 Tax=Sulfolobus polyhedral virus 2 TaxID=2493125 RepID=A0A3Q8QAB8_9VIRU|nr:SAM-dependent methyltransferase [Sulfolobus polyhedral virus 2]AZI76030.1 putative methyltransferase [Sulfolobus polyhedral virus 2]
MSLDYFNMLGKPKKSIADYFRNKGCNYWEEQDKAYGILDFNGKTVLVVGGDCGTTILYALMRGAKYVIAYEKDERLRMLWLEVCRDFNICGKAIMRGEWKGELDSADILIMDCEGCEELLKAKPNYEFCIALHKWAKVDELKSALGPNVVHTYTTPDNLEEVYCSKKS